MMEHNLLIYNPVSGKTILKEEYLGRVIHNLTKDGDEITVYQTQKKGDASTYLKKIKFNYDKIICCGGDGTLHEVVEGLMNISERPVLGYIPSGSTNDYAKNIGITKENAISYIRTGNSKYIDVGKFNDKYFNYVAAFGAFTNVPFITSQKAKNILGYFAYLLEGVKHLSEIEAKHIQFQVDEKIMETDIVVGMVTNAFFVAGIINTGNSITKLDDGLMEYMFVKMPQSIIELQAIIASLVGGKIDDRFVYFGQAKNINYF